MKVYYVPGSRAVRTVWLLEEIGQTYELARFTLGQKEMRGPEYIKINPNGRVPTLIDGDVTISESTAIAQYLGAKYAPELTPGPDAPNFAMYLQWLYQRRKILTRKGFPFWAGCDSRLAKEIRHVSMHCSSGRLRQH